MFKFVKKYTNMPNFLTMCVNKRSEVTFLAHSEYGECLCEAVAVERRLSGMEWSGEG